jgi:hypothetical protein
MPPSDEAFQKWRNFADETSFPSSDYDFYLALLEVWEACFVMKIPEDCWIVGWCDEGEVGERCAEVGAFVSDVWVERVMGEDRWRIRRLFWAFWSSKSREKLRKKSKEFPKKLSQKTVQYSYWRPQLQTPLTSLSNPPQSKTLACIFSKKHRSERLNTNNIWRFISLYSIM